MQADIEKRNIHIGCDIARKVHCRHIKRYGARKHYRLLTDVETLVLLVGKLCKVVNKADCTANQYKKHRVEQAVVTRKKAARPQNKRNRANRNYKDNSARQTACPALTCATTDLFPKYSARISGGEATEAPKDLSPRRAERSAALTLL